MELESRQAVQVEWRELGRAVGQAFAEDPVSLWTLGNSAAVSATFTQLGRRVYLPRGLCHHIPGIGGSMWLHPGGSKSLPLFAQLQLLPHLNGFTGLKRALAVDKAMQLRRPQWPHYYLFAVGVLPQWRGKGLARQILAPVLERADSLGLPCWLENSNPLNESLYRGLGFAPVETFEAAPGCPPLTTMVREARAQRG